MAEEQCSACTARPAVTNIGNNRVAGRSRHGHSIHPMTFTANLHGTGLPVEVIELQSGHFDGTQSQILQATQDGVVTPADGVIAFAGVSTASLSAAERDLGSDASRHCANFGSRPHNVSALGSVKALKCRYPRMDRQITERERGVQLTV